MAPLPRSRMPIESCGISSGFFFAFLASSSAAFDGLSRNTTKRASSLNRPASPRSRTCSVAPLTDFTCSTGSFFSEATPYNSQAPSSESAWPAMRFQMSYAS